MNRELLTATIQVLQANTESLYAVAKSKGIQMPHPAFARPMVHSSRSGT